MHTRGSFLLIRVVCGEGSPRPVHMTSLSQKKLARATCQKSTLSSQALLFTTNTTQGTALWSGFSFTWPCISYPMAHPAQEPFLLSGYHPAHLPHHSLSPPHPHHQGIPTTMRKG